MDDNKQGTKREQAAEIVHEWLTLDRDEKQVDVLIDRITAALESQGEVREIVEGWASENPDGIDDLDALCKIAAVLGIEVEARKDSVCNWTLDDDGVYFTDCDNAWQFEAGTAAENKVVYCPFCGKQLRESQQEGK